MAFDLYVKVNDKHILYIRQGEMLEEERLEKIKHSEGQRFYITKEALKSYKNYVGDLLEDTLQVELRPSPGEKPREPKDFDYQDTVPRTPKKTGASEVNVKLSPAMRAVLAQAAEEGPTEKLSRQAHIVQNVAKTAVDVVHKLMEDPESLTSYQIANKAAQGIVHALEQSPEMIGELVKYQPDEQHPLITHSKNVACLSVALGMRVGLQRGDLIDLAQASLIHDIGLMKIDQYEDMFSRPRPELTEEQSKLYHDHGKISFSLAEDKDFISANVKELVKYHEENLSGTGPCHHSDLNVNQQVLSLVNRFDKILIEQHCSLKAAFQYLAINEIGNYDLKLIETLKKLIPMDMMNQKAEGWGL
jgi:HD-GYP domain-containing protein (c-di-GMP phosphodiesterase class II)